MRHHNATLNTARKLRETMIRVAIIGCGKIADAHAEQIQRISGCEIVGVCDSEELMARQLSERFHIKYHFTDVRQLLEKTHPNVVHVTTPPQSHFKLAEISLDSGCHVYVEKPFTLSTTESQKLLDLATKRGLKITVGHDDQFTHAARRMREMINKGYLGGTPVHMESYYCYDLGDATYAKALLGDKTHWVRSLPGKLLHNNISHGISKITEFLNSDSPEVIATGFTSPFLQSMGETEIIDELRVIIHDKSDQTAYFTFSSQMRPTLHHFRLYGHSNGIMVDHHHQTVIKLRGTKYKSYLDKFVPPYVFAKQYISNSTINMRKFLKRDFHMKSGMKFLIESFYTSIVNESKLPISYREILLTSKIMDNIFEQIYPVQRS